MSTIALETPEAAALSAAIHSKIVDEGWTPEDDTSLADYIVLMLANGKTQDQIASELAGELLQDAKGTPEFAQWLFEQVNALSSGASAAATTQQTQQAQAQAPHAAAGDMAVDSNEPATSSIPAAYDMDVGESAPENAPRGPKGLHGGRPSARGARGGLSKGGDSALHRVRGNDRINSHGNVRGAPKGPRGQGRDARPGMQKALNNLMGGGSQGLPNQMMQNGGQPAMMTPQQQMDMLSMMEQQTRMMAAMMQAGQGMAFQQQQNGGSRSLADRIEPARGRGGRGRGRGAHQAGANRGAKTGDADTAMETESTADSAMETEQSGEAQQQRKVQDPANTLCHFNLRCTNKDCPYVHQSPAAPEGTVVDMNETCSFGAGCKNPQCKAKHPSPAQARGQELCKFFPNCTKANCPFKHPSMPPCRFGANCKTPNCQFTHLPAPPCKFNPCTNARCPFKHEPGQQKIPNLADYQWTPESAKLAEQNKEHVSERKFVADDAGEEELIRPEGAVAANGETAMREEVIT